MLCLETGNSVFLLLTGQHFFQGFVDQLGVCLPPRLLHDLTHKETQELGLALPILRHLLFMGTQDLCNYFRDGIAIRDLDQTFFFHDRLWSFA
jgi:hypothetical protein